jgi:hypothetical protein
MNKSVNEDATQTNKKSKRESQNVMKKYLKSYNELRKSIIENQKRWQREKGET